MSECPFPWKGFPPPLKDVYTAIPNVFFDDLLPILTDEEVRVMLVLLRATYGFRKAETEMSLAEIQRRAGMAKGRVMQGLRGRKDQRDNELPNLGCLGKGLVEQETRATPTGARAANRYKVKIKYAAKGQDVDQPQVGILTLCPGQDVDQPLRIVVNQKDIDLKEKTLAETPNGAPVLPAQEQPETPIDYDTLSPKERFALRYKEIPELIRLVVARCETRWGIRPGINGGQVTILLKRWLRLEPVRRVADLITAAFDCGDDFIEKATVDPGMLLSSGIFNRLRAMYPPE